MKARSVRAGLICDGITYTKQLLKKELKALIIGKLMELKVIVVPAQSEPAVLEDGTLSEVAGELEGDLHGAQVFLGVEGEADEWMKTLARFDPLGYDPVFFWTHPVL